MVFGTSTKMTQPKDELDEQAIDFLKDECNRLQTLYLQMQDSAQSIFNFYLTLASTIVGALIVLLQASTLDAIQTRLIIMGLLAFSTIVGTVYLSAMSGRYAHLARYSYAIDEIRKYLIQRLKIPVPEVYREFMQSEKVTPKNSWRKRLGLLIWLFPTGTYAMFIAIVSSLSLGILTGLIASLGDVSAGGLFGASAWVFIITLTVFNVYSRFFINRVSKRLHVRISSGHMGEELGAWAGKN
jgi:hypothetical protein